MNDNVIEIEVDEIEANDDEFEVDIDEIEVDDVFESAFSITKSSDSRNFNSETDTEENWK